MVLTPKIIGLFLIIAGAAAIVFFLRTLIREKSEKKKYGEAEAAVIGFRQVSKTDGDEPKSISCPVVSYTVGEREIKTLFRDLTFIEGEECRYSTGDTVRIRYELRRPEKCSESVKKDKSRTVAAAGVIAGVLVTAAGIYVRTMKR